MTLGQLTPGELARLAGGTWDRVPPDDWRAAGLCFRNGPVPPGSLVIPPGGSFRYGVDLERVELSALRGCALLVDTSFGEGPPLPRLTVPCVRSALGAIAIQARDTVRTTLCAVTGSVGKTSTSSLLHSALQRCGTCAPAQFAWNTRDGTVAQLAALSGEAYAVIEVAVSAIPRLPENTALALAVVTQVSPAHLAGVGSLDELVERKAGIFARLRSGGIAIINRAIPGYARLREVAERHAARVVTYGDHPAADVRLLAYRPDLDLVQACVHGEAAAYRLPGMKGRHMACNSLAALAAVQALGLDWREAAAAFREVRSARGRGRRHRVTVDGRRFVIVDDSYNASPAAVVAGLDLLATMQPAGAGGRVVVLADMLQLGPEEARYHAELAGPIRRSGVRRVHVAGELMAHLWHALPAGLRGRKVATAEELLPILRSEISEGDVVYFKGSRRSGLYKVVRQLRDLDGGAPPAPPVAGARAPGLAGRARRLAGRMRRFLARNLPGRGPEPPRVRVSEGPFALTLWGDTCLGDSYLEGQDEWEHVHRRLRDSPLSFFRQVRPLIAGSDYVVANLETCLVSGMTSPFEGRKPYILRDDPERTLGVLRELGVDAANLANNHAKDFGAEGLLATMSCLRKAGIRPFGAGGTRADAARPLRVTARVGDRESEIIIVSGFERTRRYREQFDFYAGAGSPGVNPLSRTGMPARIGRLRAASPGALIVACPHWSKNYRWVGERELALSAAMVDAGADLVLGHGLHMLGQCRWTAAGTEILSLGNFIFNAPGRYAQFDAPPYSLVARLELNPGAEGWSAALKLYPIVTDNRLTDFQVRPVDGPSLAGIHDLLAEHASDPAAFRGAFEAAEDDRGPHLRLSRAISPRFAVPSWR